LKLFYEAIELIAFESAVVSSVPVGVDVVADVELPAASA
jgi:hypothetical protein